MSKFFIWVLLSWFLGNPLFAALVLLIVFWGVGHYTFAWVSSPFQIVRKYRRIKILESLIFANPHDRRARLELSELYLGRRRFRDELEILRPNFESGDKDVTTLYVLGIACYGTGHYDTAEQLIAEAEKADANFRGGEIDLERGRWRLRRGDAAGAREALERFCGIRRGTVEGRVLLAQALKKEGNHAGAQAFYDEAWLEYRAAPRFRRRVERVWAWRAKPWRPMLYGAIVGAVAAILLLWIGPPSP